MYYAQLNLDGNLASSEELALSSMLPDDCGIAETSQFRDEILVSKSARRNSSVLLWGAHSFRNGERRPSLLRSLACSPGIVQPFGQQGVDLQVNCLFVRLRIDLELAMNTPSFRCIRIKKLTMHSARSLSELRYEVFNEFLHVRLPFGRHRLRLLLEEFPNLRSRGIACCHAQPSECGFCIASQPSLSGRVQVCQPNLCKREPISGRNCKVRKRACIFLAAKQAFAFRVVKERLLD